MKMVIYLILFRLIFTFPFVFGDDTKDSEIGNFNHAKNNSESETYLYRALSLEITKEGTDETIENTLLKIGELKSSVEFINLTQIQEFETSFNETCTNYKRELIPVLEKYESSKKPLFSNIELESQEKILQTLREFNKTNEKTTEIYKSVPINYVKDFDVTKWYRLLDSVNLFAISMLSGSTGKKPRNQALNRENLMELLEKVDHLLIVFSHMTSTSSCKQIAWSLVANNHQIENYNNIARKLIKMSQSSMVLLKSKNEPVLNQFNSLALRRTQLDSNLRGLLDLLIKVRSDEQDSLIILDDLSQDLQSLKAHLSELAREKTQWILSNRNMVKPLLNWLQASVVLIYKVLLTVSKSVIAYHLRNLSDLVYTIAKEDGDLGKLKERLEMSLDIFERSIKSLGTKIFLMRHTKEIGIFKDVLKKLKIHTKSLRDNYLGIWEDLFHIIRRKGPKLYLEGFLQVSRPLINELWSGALRYPFRFDSESEEHHGKIKGLFKKVHDFLKSDYVAELVGIQAKILKVRYYNEMLLPELRLQIGVFHEELEKYFLTEIFDEEKLRIQLSQTFLNGFIQRCNFMKENMTFEQRARLGISNKLISKYSMWETDLPIIIGEKELDSLSVNFLLQRSKSLVKNFFETEDQVQDIKKEVVKKETIEKLKKELLELYSRLKNELQELKEEGSRLVPFSSELFDKTQKVGKFIKHLESAISGTEEAGGIDLDLLVNDSQRILKEFGALKESLPKMEKQISKGKVKNEVNRYKGELMEFRLALNKGMRIVKKISALDSEIRILEDSNKFLENFLFQLQGQIELFCERIDKKRSDKTSRALSILKYAVRKKKPDTECESLLVEFSTVKSELTNLIKSASEAVNEYHIGVGVCKELEEISSKFGTFAKNFRDTRRSLELLEGSFSVESFEKGKVIVERSLQALSQNSKGMIKELKCYEDLISAPETISVLIKSIKREIFKLQNTIGRELNNHIYEGA
ncbi:hypothetical protein HWI79_1953 [Cryptosporidium felis]|nr:hypothetical protein HWI79_1953 [Cryptosporidium felis]